MLVVLCFFTTYWAPHCAEGVGERNYSWPSLCRFLQHHRHPPLPVPRARSGCSVAAAERKGLICRQQLSLKNEGLRFESTTKWTLGAMLSCDVVPEAQDKAG